MALNSKTISSKVLIRKIFRDLKPSKDNWIDDAVEWIGEALEHIGAAPQLKQQQCVLEIVDHKVLGLKHSFADQVYIRQMEMEQGRLVVGAIHNHLHVWFLMSGHITVATENESNEYIAPCHVLATPGTKRVIYANEDSVFVNVQR